MLVASALSLSQSSQVQKNIGEILETTNKNSANKQSILYENQDMKIDFFEKNSENPEYNELIKLHEFAQNLTAFEENTAFRRYFLAQILQESRWDLYPKNSRSSAIGLGQIIWNQTENDLVLGPNGRGSRYIKFLRDLKQKNPNIFMDFDEPIRSGLEEICETDNPELWAEIIKNFEKNLENPHVNLLLSYMILKLKLQESNANFNENSTPFESFKKEYRSWGFFLDDDYHDFIDRVEVMNEDEMKMLVAVGRYNGHK